MRRRELAGAALAGGAALALGGSPLHPGQLASAWADAGDPLGSVAAVEQAVTLAYAIALGRPGLRPADRRLVAILHDHERRHRDAVNDLLIDLRRPPQPPDGHLADVDRYLPGLGAARTAAQVLAFAIELEEVALAIQSAAIGQLDDVHQIQTIAAIAAGEGQHLLALRLALGRQPLPAALEAGRRPARPR